MKTRTNRQLTLCLALALTFAASCGKSKKSKDGTELVPNPNQETLPIVGSEDGVDSKVKTILKQYPHAPSLTLIMIPKENVRKSITSLVKNGGELVYDPNNGYGSEIPFFIATLTAKQINDSKFIETLNLKSISVDSKFNTVKPVSMDLAAKTPSTFIPVDSVKLETLLTNGQEQKDLGKGITVAVIDTGIDASHPAFNGRVDYWYDATEETKTELLKAENKDGEISITVDGKVAKVKLPESAPKGETLYAVLDEKEYLSQLSEETQNELGFRDINQNGIADKFLVVLVKTDKGEKLLIDSNGSLSFDHSSEEAVKVDYNETSQNNRIKGMVDFPSRNNTTQYPLLVTSSGDKKFIGLGIPDGMHGTHVAGIIAANYPEANLLGAAPSARLMSLRVCSDISCTDSAIIKALYQAFYNGKHIPDVVNISLGSHEKEIRDVYSHVFNDLSAKFGTIFFISASNSGAGFRTLNHFGNNGSVVMVGANVSKQTLLDQYNLPASANLPDEMLLYFSSLGPSYTSEMKPNIVAPGAAISSVLFREGAIGQANGTSMSSPLAAGTMAAVLGKLKEKDSEALSKVEKLRKKNLTRPQKASGSLLPYVYAMRDAVQMGAVEISHLTRVQQGYGLMHAGNTLDLLEKNVEKLNNDETDFFEVVINDYKQSYFRNKETQKVQTFKLTLGFDGERTQEQKAKILANGITAVLDRVEVINTRGEVQKLTDDKKLKYFHIVDLGDENNLRAQTPVTFNNNRTTGFYSFRHLSSFKEAHSYIAHYKLMYKGNNVGNILDVVHSPIKLKKTDISVPSISLSKTSTNSGYALAGQKISVNTTHRYPVYVSEDQTSFELSVALARGSNARAFVQVYSPEGKEIVFDLAQNTALTSYAPFKQSVSTTKKGKVQQGIWEITISTPSSTWLSGANYDLLIENNSFGTENAKHEMKAGDTLELAVNTSNEKLESSFAHSTYQAHIQEVEVKSHHLSFHPLVAPKGVEKLLITSHNDKESYWGRIDQSLYTKDSAGNFVKAKDIKVEDQDGSLLVSELKSTEGLYFALDTIINYSFVPEESEIADKVEIMTVYMKDVEVETEIETSELNSKLSLLKLKVEKESELKPVEEGAKVYVLTKLTLTANESEEVTTSDGGDVVIISGDKPSQTLFVLIQY